MDKHCAGGKFDTRYFYLDMSVEMAAPYPLNTHTFTLSSFARNAKYRSHIQRTHATVPIDFLHSKQYRHFRQTREYQMQHHNPKRDIVNSINMIEQKCYK
jgi:hypothetical protein